MHPRLAEVITEMSSAAVEPADDQFARVLGLMLDGLLQVPGESPQQATGRSLRPERGRSRSSTRGWC